MLTRSDGSVATRELILDDFMKGFLFELYQQKWRKFGWHLPEAHTMHAFAHVYALNAALAEGCVVRVRCRYLHLLMLTSYILYLTGTCTC